MIKYIFTVVFVVFLTGCGYKPVSYYTDKTLSDEVSITVKMNYLMPENVVIVHDAIHEAVLLRLGKKIVKQGKSDTHINLSINSVTFTPLLYDKYGYVTQQQAKVKLVAEVIRKDKKNSKINIFGTHDFSINTDLGSLMSERDRYDAIKKASLKALDNFLAKLVILDSK